MAVPMRISAADAESAPVMKAKISMEKTRCASFKVYL